MKHTKLLLGLIFLIGIIFSGFVGAYSVGNLLGNISTNTTTGILTYAPLNSAYLNFSRTGFVSLGNAPYLSPNITNAYTISTWIYVNDFNFAGNLGTTGLKRIAGKGGNTYEFTLNVANSSSSIGANVSQFQLFGGTGSNLCNSISTVALTPNQWHHIVGQWDGFNCTVYSDGRLIKVSQRIANQNLTNGTNNLKIGSLAGATADENFSGRIDHVQIYNHSLSPLQIRRMYNESIYGSGLGRGIPVLSYHNIAGDSDQSTIVSYNNFTQQMNYLNSSGYRTITYNDYLQWKLYNNYTLPDKPIILVFDDGWMGTYTNASTIMNNYGYVGVLGMVTSYAGTAPYMSWANVSTLKNSGWQIASHSVTHVDFTTLTIAEMTTEFSNSKNEILGNTSSTPTLFIFPFNSNNDSIDSLCSQYYTMCSGYSSGTAGFENFLFKNANLTHENGYASPGLRRIIIANDTNITQLVGAVDYYENLVAFYKFDEPIGSGNIVYDSSPMQKNATISGAVRLDDGLRIRTTDFTTYINISNLMNSLIFKDNYQMINSSASGNINLTLFYNDSYYILDNFNVTEGQGRLYSPIGFTSITNEIKIINSNLTTITTTPVYISTTSPGRLIHITYNGQTYERSSFNINGNIVSINLNIPAGQSTMNLVYGCSGNESFTFTIIMITSALGLLVSVVVLFLNRGKVIEKIGVGTFVVVFVTLCIGIAFLVQIGNDIFTYCGAI